LTNLCGQVSVPKNFACFSEHCALCRAAINRRVVPQIRLEV
jgi:hypothetical protein